MNVRTRILVSGIALGTMVVLAALAGGCAPTAPAPQPPAAVTPAPSTPATPSAPATPPVTGVALGKMIFVTGADNSGPIATKFGIATITVNACKNCHGANGKGGKGLPGPDIRGSVLRPDFDQAKFARAVTTGVDDTGKALHSKMPRFSATSEDTAALWKYVLTLK